MNLKNKDMTLLRCFAFNYTVAELLLHLAHIQYFYFDPDDIRSDYSCQKFLAYIQPTASQLVSLIEKIEQIPSILKLGEDSNQSRYNLPSDINISVTVTRTQQVVISIGPEYQNFKPIAITENHLRILNNIDKILQDMKVNIPEKIEQQNVVPLYGERYLGKENLITVGPIEDYKKVKNWISGHSFDECLLLEDEIKEKIKMKRKEEALKSQADRSYVNNFEKQAPSLNQFMGEALSNVVEVAPSRVNYIFYKLKKKIKSVINKN